MLQHYRAYFVFKLASLSGRVFRKGFCEEPVVVTECFTAADSVPLIVCLVARHCEILRHALPADDLAQLVLDLRHLELQRVTRLGHQVVTTLFNRVPSVVSQLLELIVEDVPVFLVLLLDLVQRLSG